MSKSNDQVWLFRRACYERFEFFTKFLVSVLKPHRGFEWNWHHEVIADRLGQCVDGPVQRLVINQPPRSAKSTFASVAFPLWCLLRDPSREILCISYGEELGRQFTEESRTFVQNRRVQALFPGVWRIGKRNGEILGSKGGRRYPVSAGGAITGRGADLIIIDDPLKASEAHQKARDNINDWYDANIYQRLNNKNTGCFVLVMQRLHERDLSNHIMTGVGRIDRLILPSIASTDETWELSNSRIFSRPAGASLQEDRESLSRLKEVRETIGGYNFMAQYQQQPASHEEAIIKEDWFQGYFDWEIGSSEGAFQVFQSYHSGMGHSDKSG